MNKGTISFLLELFVIGALFYTGPTGPMFLSVTFAVSVGIAWILGLIFGLMAVIRPHSKSEVIFGSLGILLFGLSIYYGLYSISHLDLRIN